jgi:formate dehydrogenase alpha subunit
VEKFSITIDGKELEAFAGQTILDLAKAGQIYIPTLCCYPGTKLVGACRVCVVEVEGQRTLAAACSTPVSPGMVIRTDTERVRQAQRLVVELLWSSGDHNCLVCEANGRCELQDLIYWLKIEKPRFPIESPEYLLDKSNTMIERDLNKCILCGRCVRACNEIQVNEVLDFFERGSKMKVGPAFDTDYFDSNCVFCGECVDACPTGAIINKQSRFEGRPWETEKVRTTCGYCGVGCQMDLQVRNGKVVNVTGNSTYGPPNQGSLCVKGRFGMEFIGHPSRLKTPLIKENGEFRKASWDEAYDFIAARFASIKQKHGPDSLAGFASARCTNEENYLFQKFMRAAIGTNNVDHCARLCHSVTVAGLAAAFGSGAMTNSADEIEKANVILAIGTNTTETHPVIGSKVKRAVRQRGANLIVIDPREIALVPYAALWLRPRTGTNVACINGIMHVIVRENLHDADYIEKRTEGLEAMRELLAEYTPEYVEGITGVPAEDIRKAARLYAGAEKASILYCMGVTQLSTGTDSVKSIANLAMLCGNIGMEGGGVNPLRGQNNVQGACDMGALPDVFPAYQKVAAADVREKFKKNWGIFSLSENPGKTIVEVMNAIATGEIRGLYVMGENPMLSDPDLHHVEEALSRLDFLVVQDIFLSDTARFADVVLPSACFAEKDGTFTNTERRIQRVRKAVSAPGEAKPDWTIIAELSTKMGYPMSYPSAEEIMDEIAWVAPSYGGICYARIENRGLQWPCPDSSHPGTPYLHRDRFARGLGLFHPVEYVPSAEVPDQNYPFILTTGRVLYHYHTGTMTRLARGANERYPESLVEINPADAEKNGIGNGDMVRVISRRGAVSARACITKRSPEGTVFMNFHFKEAAVNLLTNPVLDPTGKIPEYKICAVKIELAA